MNATPHRSPGRLLRFALRCGDDELVDLLLRALDRSPASPHSALASRTYVRLAARIGIASAQ
jgi:hypothetical protein